MRSNNSLLQYVGPYYIYSCTRPPSGLPLNLLPVLPMLLKQKCDEHSSVLTVKEIFFRIEREGQTF